jgi:hypothetical protein
VCAPSPAGSGSTPAWIATLVAIVAGLTSAYAPLCRCCYEQLKPESSHGFLVPVPNPKGATN